MKIRATMSQKMAALIFFVELHRSPLLISNIVKDAGQFLEQKALEKLLKILFISS